MLPRWVGAKLDFDTPGRAATYLTHKRTESPHTHRGKGWLLHPPSISPTPSFSPAISFHWTVALIPLSNLGDDDGASSLAERPFLHARLVGAVELIFEGLLFGPLGVLLWAQKCCTYLRYYLSGLFVPGVSLGG